MLHGACHKCYVGVERALQLLRLAFDLHKALALRCPRGLWARELHNLSHGRDVDMTACHFVAPASRQTNHTARLDLEFDCVFSFGGEFRIIQPQALHG